MGANVELALVRDAVRGDAPGIAAIGKVSIPETYRGIVDATVLRNIVKESYSVGAVAESIRSCASSKNAHFLVAEGHGRIAGFLHYDSFGPEPELHRIYIDPQLKRMGIGTALIHELHRRLVPGASYILMVIAANMPAVNFYKRHGLVEAERVDGPTYMSEHMGVTMPKGAQPAPALVMRFTKSKWD